MLAMQQLQPELKKLQAKYKDDRQKLNEEMMKFYKENNINPVSGCLPLLLQMPVFFFLYRTLFGLTDPRRPTAPTWVAAAAGDHPQRRRALGSFGFFQPQHLDKSSQRCIGPQQHPRDEVLRDEPGRVRASRRSSTASATPLPYIAAGPGRDRHQLRPAEAGLGAQPATAQVNPQQQMLLKIMPLFFAFISLGLPAGIVVYFLVSNLFRIGQQAFITRTMYADGGILATTATEVDSSSKTKSQPAPERKGILGALGLGAGSATTGRQPKGKVQPKNKVQAKSKDQPKTNQRNVEGRVETGTSRRSGQAGPATRSGRVGPSCAQAGAAERRAGEPTVGQPTGGRRPRVERVGTDRPMARPVAPHDNHRPR